MTIPTEPIGSIPRPRALLDAIGAFGAGTISRPELDAHYDAAVRDTIEQLESTGSPVITDGEQAKPSFLTYPVSGIETLAADGVTVPFADGHVRRLPRLTAGPFAYTTFASNYLDKALGYTRLPVKQAVISPSALSLLYPADGIAGYSKERFLEDLVRESETDIRRCLERGAYKVQIDFTDARLSAKLDPSLRLLRALVTLNNRVLARFSERERQRIGVHICAGSDQDSTHSADTDCAALLPILFELEVGSFYVPLAGERDRLAVLRVLQAHATAGRRIFVGVIDPISGSAETAEEVCDRVLEAAGHIPTACLGTTDDCGFAPFADDTSTARELAVAKLRARVVGTRLAAEKLGWSILTVHHRGDHESYIPGAHAGDGARS